MRPLRVLLPAAAVVALSVFCHGGNTSTTKGDDTPASSIYVAVNEDVEFPSTNRNSFYVAQGTQLTFQSEIMSGGYGIQGGFFGTSRITTVPSSSAPCFYVSNAGSNSIATVSTQSQQFVSTFNASATDDGSVNGIGLAANASFLYASFTNSNTIATFSIVSGCGLTFLGDVSAVGLQGGSVSGMAVNASILVVAYGDGSIQSFGVSGGMPVSNNDLQNSAGFSGGGLTSPSGNMPSGVDISRDGRFAIFGDISAAATLEVSSLASGKLAHTTAYKVGLGVDAGAIRLSPDQSLIYMANSESGTVAAAFFNASTGKITTGCTSPTLIGFNGRPWLGSVVTRDATGTGNVLYVVEFGRDYLEPNHGPASEVGVLNVTSNGTSCTLTEASNSPVTLYSPGVLSIGVYPPRAF